MRLGMDEPGLSAAAAQPLPRPPARLNRSIHPPNHPLNQVQSPAHSPADPLNQVHSPAHSPAQSGPLIRPLTQSTHGPDHSPAHPPSHPLHQVWEAHVRQEALQLAIADHQGGGVGFRTAAACGQPFVV